ncbi:MAG: ATP-grasp domain-containing protein [Desulfobacterales bacterium]|nr:ATP-grasp domain-containing protein [Desulfobacterales bacterium]
MDILYISPDFPPNFAHFVKHLHREGLRVWAIGEADFYSLPADLRACIRWYARADLNNWRKAEQAINELLEVKHAQGFEGAFDLVESHNEAWLRLEAFINERLVIPGITLREVDQLKKKSVMKRIFQESGLRVARGAIVSTVQEATRLAGELGYPVILKPNEGVGAGGTHRLDAQDRLEAVFEELRDDYLLEEFVEAPIVTYDGLTDQEGNILFENSLIYGEGLIEYAQGKDTFFYVSRRVPEALGHVGQSLAQRFDVRRKFFHFEFFKLAGDYMPIEINCRPPGGAIIDMMNYSIDGDLYRAWARMLMRRPLELPQAKKFVVAFVGRKDKPHALTHGQLVEQLGPRLVECAENPPLYWEVMGRFRYIFRCAAEAEAVELAAVARQEA